MRKRKITTWNNNLVIHSLEMVTNDPKTTIRNLKKLFLFICERKMKISAQGKRSR